MPRIRKWEEHRVFHEIPVALEGSNDRLYSMAKVAKRVGVVNDKKTIARAKSTLCNGICKPEVPVGDNIGLNYSHSKIRLDRFHGQIRVLTAHTWLSVPNVFTPRAREIFACIFQRESSLAHRTMLTTEWAGNAGWTSISGYRVGDVGM